MFAYFAAPGSLILVVAAFGLGVAAIFNARHINQVKHHEIDPAD